MKRLLFLPLLLAAGAVFAQGTPSASTAPSVETNKDNTSTTNKFPGGYAVQPNSAGTPAAGGSGNAVGDILTLSDGCSTHATLVVNGVSGGGVTGYNINNPGICGNPPTNPVAVASTTGTGSGATFTLNWGLISYYQFYGSLTNNGGNLFLNPEFGGAYSGTESTFIGDRAATRIATGNFNFIGGHGAGGIGCPGGTNTQWIDSSVIIGTDTLRNDCGSSTATIIGQGAYKTYNQIGTSANHYLYGTTATGHNVGFNWNGAVSFPYNTLYGDTDCPGAGSGTISFSGIACYGANIGNALTTATNGLILAGGTSSNVAQTWASGHGVVLIASGDQAVDTPAAGTSSYINLENILTVTGTNTPSTSASTIAGSLNVVGNVTYNGQRAPFVFSETAIPFILGSSGSMGNNGALTYTTALATTYANAYCYMPASAISSGSAAGWYFCQMSSATAGTVFNNVYTSGVPTVPGSPTAFVTTGPGAYTQTINTGLNALNILLPANSMGSSGQVVLEVSLINNNSAGNKTVNAFFGGTLFGATGNITTLTGTKLTAGLQNRAVTNSQLDTYSTLNGATPTLGTGYLAIDTTLQQSVLLKQNIVSAATDYLVVEGYSIKVYPN